MHFIFKTRVSMNVPTMNADTAWLKIRSREQAHVVGCSGKERLRKIITGISGQKEIACEKCENRLTVKAQTDMIDAIVQGHVIAHAVSQDDLRFTEAISLLTFIDALGKLVLGLFRKKLPKLVCNLLCMPNLAVCKQHERLTCIRITYIYVHGRANQIQIRQCADIPT